MCGYKMKNLFATRAKFSRSHAKNLIYFSAHGAQFQCSYNLDRVLTSLAIFRSNIAVYWKSVFILVLDK